VNELEASLENERRLVENLESKHQALLSRIDAMTHHEMELREEAHALEKTLTLLKHDLKEVT